MPVSSSSYSIATEAVQRKFNPRALLPLAQNHLWKVESGAVRTMTWLEDGTTITLGLWGAGDVVGQPLSQVNPYQVECLTKVEAVNFSIHHWQQREEALFACLRQAEELLVIRSYRRTDEMLLRLLDWLAQKFGREADQGRLIDLRLTHQDLAELLGSTRVTVTRMLSQFEQQGLIARLPLHRIVLKEEDLWHYEI